MAEDETRRVILSQPPGAALAVSGSDCHDPLSHRLAGDIVHRTDQPVVHMHLWDEARTGRIEARIEHRVDAGPDDPINLAHRFPETHHQTHVIATALAEPVHHALQMRTPLQVRFCNTWQVASDYTVQVALRGRPFLELRLTGATVATPRPCPEDDCAPAVTAPVHP